MNAGRSGPLRARSTAEPLVMQLHGIVIMPDKRTLEPADALAAFPLETDDRRPLAMLTPLRGRWDSTLHPVTPLTDARVPVLIKSVQALANKVDALSVTTVTTRRRLTRWVIGLTVLCGLLVLAVLAQTYLWLTITRSAR
jgi:hypothetical protein